MLICKICFIDYDSRYGLLLHQFHRAHSHNPDDETEDGEVFVSRLTMDDWKEICCRYIEEGTTGECCGKGSKERTGM